MTHVAMSVKNKNKMFCVAHGSALLWDERMKRHNNDELPSLQELFSLFLLCFPLMSCCGMIQPPEGKSPLVTNQLEIFCSETENNSHSFSFLTFLSSPVPLSHFILFNSIYKIHQADKTPTHEPTYLQTYVATSSLSNLLVA